MKTEFAATREDPCKFFRGIAAFGGIQAYADPQVTILRTQGQRFFQGREGIFFRQMTQERHDHGAAEAVVVARFTQGAGDPCKYYIDADTAFGMGLRIEENFRMAHVVGA